MHVKSLKVFCDIVGRRSFSRAADENGMSQSGASQMVHQLEECLGVKLIDRSKRPFVLTPEGEIYYEGCRKLVQRYYALEEVVRTHHKEVVGRVSVACIYSVGLSHIDQFVKRFQQTYSQADVRVEYRHPDKVVQRVEGDQVDIGLISYPKPTRRLDALPWRDEAMLLVCSPQHALAERQTVSLAELQGQKFVAFDADLKIRRAIDRALAAEQAEPKIALEFDNIESIKRAVEINAGVSILPAPTVVCERESGALRAIPLAETALVRPLGIVFRRGKELGETALRFIEMLQSEGQPPPCEWDLPPAVAASGGTSTSPHPQDKTST